MERSQFWSRFIKTIVVVLILSFSAPLAWGGADVYLIYSGKNKAEKKIFKKAFPKGIKVKAYNADLLAVADYSGVQKAASKFDRAKVIVILRDRPMEMLKGISVKKNLIIIESVKTTVKSSAVTRYLFKAGTDVSALEGAFKKKLVKKLSDSTSGSLLVIDENGPEIQKVLSHLVEKMLRR